MAAAGSDAPNTALPATRTLAPGARLRGRSALTPPSTWISSSGRRALSAAILGSTEA